MKITADFIFNSMLIVFFSSMLGISSGWPGKRGFFPLIVAIIGLCLCLGQLVKNMIGFFRSESVASETSEQGVKVIRRQIRQKATAESEVKAVLWMVAGLAIILVFGFWVAIPAYTVIFMRLYGHESWKLITAIAGSAWIVCYLLFHITLKFSLYGGLLDFSFF